MPASSESGDLPGAYRDLLFLQWVNTIAQAELSTTQYGQSGEQWQFMQYPEGNGFYISPSPDRPGYSIETHGETQLNDVESIIQRALVAAQSQDTGQSVWYHGGFSSDEPDILGTPAQFVRNMGDKRTIEGWRRLSDLVLLEFKPEPVENPSPLNAPKTDIRVFLKVPGGSPGPFSSKIASDALEFVRLICSFALGRPVSGFAGTAFPSDERDSKTADERQQDYVNVLSLARNGVPLDPFAHLASLGGPESIARYRGSLVAYDAAIEQKNPDVATILFVSCIEALLSPQTDWRKERLTARFIRAVIDYAPSDVDAVLQHQNVEMALGFNKRGGLARQRRDLLSHIYDLRSTPVHAGPAMAMGLLGADSLEGQMRVALMSDLAQGVILSFLTAPRSSLIGHPIISPGGNDKP